MPLLSLLRLASSAVVDTLAGIASIAGDTRIPSTYATTLAMNLLSPEIWRYPIEVGTISFTPLSVVIGAILLTILVIAIGLLKRLLIGRVFPRLGLSHGAAVAMATLAAYFLLAVGTLSILPVMVQGFNIQTLSVVLGALSFGIGFGLRNVADNFFSGIIILLERPIKAGDRVEVGQTYGTIIAIRARSTTIRTNDNIDIIVPNSKFISEEVTNLSHIDTKVRFLIPVGVHYQSNVRLVEKALIEAGQSCANVLKQPPPAVRFCGFGDSSLNFELRVWTDTLYDRPQALVSEVNFAIWDKFQEFGISIPYPQRDLYVKELPALPTRSPEPAS